MSKHDQPDASQGHDIRIRQVVLVAADLESAAGQLQELLGIRESFRDPPDIGDLGVVNVVMPVGDTFLEVVSPMRPTATTSRYLEKAGGDGGYMVIVQYPDIGQAKARAAGAGARFVWNSVFDDQSQWHLHPKDVGAALLALDWADPPRAWRWAGEWQDKQATSITRAIVGIDVSSRTPVELAARWQAVLGGQLVDGVPAGRSLQLGASRVNFLPDDRAVDRVTGVVLDVVDGQELLRRADRLGLSVVDGGVLCAGVVFRAA